MENVIIGGIITIIGIIVGSLITYLLNRSQQKFQMKNELNIWKRNKTIEVITQVLVQIPKLNTDLLKSGSFGNWLRNFQENILPLVLIQMGYTVWANTQDEFIKLLRIVKIDMEKQIKVSKLKKQLLESGIQDEYLNSLKTNRLLKIDDFLCTIQVNIETIMTEFLRLNFEEFKNLDYRETPKYTLDQQKINNK